MYLTVRVASLFLTAPAVVTPPRHAGTRRAASVCKAG